MPLTESTTIDEKTVGRKAEAAAKKRNAIAVANLTMLAFTTDGTGIGVQVENYPLAQRNGMENSGRLEEEVSTSRYNDPR
jgi:hypothetical protein